MSYISKRVLIPRQFPESSHEEIDSQKEESISNNHVTYQKPSKEETFLQVIPVFASNGEICIQTAALLDSGQMPH